MALSGGIRGYIYVRRVSKQDCGERGVRDASAYGSSAHDSGSNGARRQELRVSEHPHASLLNSATLELQTLLLPPAREWEETSPDFLAKVRRLVRVVETPRKGVPARW